QLGARTVPTATTAASSTMAAPATGWDVTMTWRRSTKMRRQPPDVRLRTEGVAVDIGPTVLARTLPEQTRARTARLPRTADVDGDEAAMTTPLPAGYRFAPLGPDRREELVDLTLWAFPAGVSVEEFARHPLPLVWDRSSGVVTEDGTLVGSHASHPFARFPVPGSHAAVGGLTWVCVHPGHRRRGLLRAMVHEHLAACRERGEVASALYASEPGIYGRFGYGVASTSLTLRVPKGAPLREVPGAE